MAADERRLFPNSGTRKQDFKFKVADIVVGLLLNFGRKSEFKGFVYDNKRKNISDNQRKSVAE